MTAGSPLSSEYTSENIPLVKAGCSNLAKQISNAKKFGVPVVVAVNSFATDTQSELQEVRALNTEYLVLIGHSLTVSLSLG